MGTLEDQRKCLTTIRDWADKPENKLARFMKEVPPIMDLTTVYSLEDAKPSATKKRRITSSAAEVSDEEMEQIVADLREPVSAEELNRAVVEQRVEAIADGSEPSATELPS